eukprot:5723761-Amphidinium_carterae.1
MHFPPTEAVKNRSSFRGCRVAVWEGLGRSSTTCAMIGILYCCYIDLRFGAAGYTEDNEQTKQTM